jgi:hypothetical protein
MDIIVGFGAIIIFFAAYFLPSIIAGKRQHRNTTPITLSNLFFGWTIVGWLVCLIWSTSSNVAAES